MDQKVKPSKPGLSQQLKQKLIEQSIQRKVKANDKAADKAPVSGILGRASPALQRMTDFRLHPAYRKLEIMREGSQSLGIDDPFFRVHQGTSGASALINGKQYINFSSYNYLGLTGDPRVNAAAQQAMETYGTSASASRMVSGERPVHQQLEQALAALHGCEDALVFVSGHATNVSTLGFLMGPKDLIVHDELIHNSSMVGAELSGARRIAFKHNDLQALEQVLAEYREGFERVIIVTEGLFSMDGDLPDLPAIVALKKRYHTWLMVDEAHSIGVLGQQGRGIAEYYNLAPDDVDIWMGTLSKTLSSCGGYIAGSRPMVEMLRYFAPGFLYSVGMPPPQAAAALKALELMQQEPERVAQLQANSAYFLQHLKQLGYDTGEAAGFAVVPLITGRSTQAAQLTMALFKQGINVQPIVYPAVPEKSARLRFFISSEHSREQLDQCLGLLAALRR